jgi:hypothetical protein
VDERRERLHRKLEQVLGEEEARTLIDDMGARAVTPDLLRQELGVLRHELREFEGRLEARFDSKLQLLEARTDTKLANLESRLLDKMNEQTKTLFRTFVVSNAAMVLAVGTLAFGAARLA